MKKLKVNKSEKKKKPCIMKITVVLLIDISTYSILCGDNVDVDTEKIQLTWNNIGTLIFWFMRIKNKGVDQN